MRGKVNDLFVKGEGDKARYFGEGFDGRRLKGGRKVSREGGTVDF